MARQPTNLIDHHVGSRIRARRLEIHISQEKLGAELGISFQQVQKYEKGTNRVGASRLVEIAKALNVVPGYFFEQLPGTVKSTSKASASSAITEFFTQPHAAELATAYLAIPHGASRRIVVDVACEIAGVDRGKLRKAA